MYHVAQTRINLSSSASSNQLLPAPSLGSGFGGNRYGPQRWRTSIAHVYVPMLRGFGRARVKKMYVCKGSHLGVLLGQNSSTRVFFCPGAEGCEANTWLCDPTQKPQGENLLDQAKSTLERQRLVHMEEEEIGLFD